MKRFALILALLLALPVSVMAQDYGVRVCRSDYQPTVEYSVTSAQMEAALGCFGIPFHDAAGVPVATASLLRGCYEGGGEAPCPPGWHPETRALACYNPPPYFNCASNVSVTFTEAQFLSAWACAGGPDPGVFAEYGHIYQVIAHASWYGPLTCMFEPYRTVRTAIVQAEAAHAKAEGCQ